MQNLVVKLWLVLLTWKPGRPLRSLLDMCVVKSVAIHTGQVIDNDDNVKFNDIHA